MAVLLLPLHLQMQTQIIHSNQVEPNLLVDYKGNQRNFLQAPLTCGFEDQLASVPHCDHAQNYLRDKFDL